VREKLHGRCLENYPAGESPDRWISIYVPPGYDRDSSKRYPVIYLLHALGDTDKMWTAGEGPYGTIPDLMDHGVAERRFGEMIVVMPDQHTRAGGSFYANSSATGNWEDFTVKELVAAIDARYRTLPRANSRGLAGYSMGGHGAINADFRGGIIINLLAH
jgi:enterochelin esterase-like enzyme